MRSTLASGKGPCLGLHISLSGTHAVQPYWLPVATTVLYISYLKPRPLWTIICHLQLGYLCTRHGTAASCVISCWHLERPCTTQG